MASTIDKKNIRYKFVSKKSIIYRLNKMANYGKDFPSGMSYTMYALLTIGNIIGCIAAVGMMIYLLAHPLNLIWDKDGDYSVPLKLLGMIIPVLLAINIGMLLLAASERIHAFVNKFRGKNRIKYYIQFRD